MSKNHAKADVSCITGGWGYMGRNLNGPRYWLKEEILRQLYGGIDERKVL